MHEDLLTISVLCPLQVSCITEVVLIRLIIFFDVFPCLFGLLDLLLHWLPVSYWSAAPGERRPAGLVAL